MSFHFNVKKATNVLLYIIHSLGGNVDIYRLVLILYFADLVSLKKYGLSVSGDNYIAMKFGPAPFHIFSMFRQMKEGDPETPEIVKSRFQVDKEQVTALVLHTSSMLAESEVECLFQTIQRFKADSIDSLSKESMNIAWRNANMNGEISLSDMVAESGASPEMAAYIEMSYLNEMSSFIDN